MGYRLHGASEDGDPMIFDAATWPKVEECKRAWRIAGGETHRVTRVYRKVHT